MSMFQKNLLKSKLPPLPSYPNRPNKRLNKDYSPVAWTTYFNKHDDVSIDKDTFRVYIKGDKGPVLFLLHGGGLSALGWSLFSESVSKLVECRVYAIDLRGHGSSFTQNDDDLSAETLSSDIGRIWSYFFVNENPPVVLMGHSMGGAVAVHVAARELIKNLMGLVVIDVVEGTAMDALSSMQSFLRGRPKGFVSLTKAIEWCVKSGQVRNLDSARVSMPGQIINCTTGLLGINDIGAEEGPTNVVTETGEDNPNKIVEEEEEEPMKQPLFKPPASPETLNKYKWRVDLSKSEEHWKGWFSGMSQLFLSVSVPKLLVLAGIETLDKELTVGQMQGRFQLQVLPQCGHAVHEDVPDRVADLIASFLVRYKLAEPTAEFVRPFPAC